MMRLLPPIVEPETWVLAFHRTSPYWWVRLLACGVYKHVSAFAWLPALKLWLVYDVTLSGTRIMLLPESQDAEFRIAAMVEDADLLRMPRKIFPRIFPSIVPFFCVPAIKRLVGLRCGALRPDALWRHCKRNGGKPANGAEPTPAHDRPGDARAAGAGA